MAIKKTEQICLKNRTNWAANVRGFVSRLENSVEVTVVGQRLVVVGDNRGQWRRVLLCCKAANLTADLDRLMEEADNNDGPCSSWC
jgi:hypothetical protein